MDRKRLLIVSTVLGFSAFLWWLSTTLNLPDQPIIITDTPATPDYIIDGMRVVRMNKKGNKEFSLSAKRMAHYPAEKLRRLEKVYLVQYQSDGITIHTSADNARYPDSGREIYMESNVRIIRKKNGNILGDIRSNSTRVLLK